MHNANDLLNKQDIELIELLISGSQEAFGELYARYQKQLSYYCKQYMRNEADTEDLVHDTFLQLWEKRQILPAISSFPGFIQTMAKNHILKKFRHFDVHSRFARNMLMNQTDSTNETEDTIIDNDYTKLLDELIEKLPPKQKEVFRLSRIEEYTYKEISELLQMPVGNVRRYASFALEKIKDQLLANTTLTGGA